MVCFDAITNAIFQVDSEELIQRKVQDLNEKLFHESESRDAIFNWWYQMMDELDAAIDKMDIDDETKALMKDRDHGFSQGEPIPNDISIFNYENGIMKIDYMPFEGL